MHSVLINALLSSSPDYDRLFKALSWPRESWPERERVEALAAFVEGLGAVWAGSASVAAPHRRCIQDQIESVLLTRCLPLLYRMSAESGGDVRCRESSAAVCRLVAVCVPLCDGTVRQRVALSVLPSLQPSDEELPSPGRLSVEVASEVVAALVPWLSADAQLTLTVLSSALSCVKTLPDALVPKITVRLLLPLLDGGARSASLVGLVLDDLCGWHSADRSPVVTERALLCLTAVSDHLLKPNACSESSDPRLSLRFWRMVQDGLIHRDNVSRKRALYLLKRCVARSEEEGLDCPLSPSGGGKRFGEADTFTNLVLVCWLIVMNLLQRKPCLHGPPVRGSCSESSGRIMH